MSLKLRLGLNSGIKVGATVLSGEPGVGLPQNLLSVPGTLLEDFQTVGDWTVLSGSVIADTDNKHTGSQSIKLTTPSGSNASFQKTVNWDLSAGGEFRLWLYIYGALEDFAFSHLTLYLSTRADFSKFFSISINTKRLGWNKYTFSQADFSNTGAASWSDPILRVRVRIDAAASHVAVASVDSLQAGITGVPGVMLCFDDGTADQYTQAFAMMNPHRIRGTLYSITSQIGQSGYLTSAQMQSMYNAGWDMANHTSTHTDLVSGGLNQAQIQSELSTAKGVLDGLGFTRASSHVAYPFGSYDATVLAAMTAEGMLSGRTVQNTNQPVIPPSHWYGVECQNIANTTSLATAKGYIDTAIARNRIALLLFHYLVVSPTVSTEWAISDFQALVDYIVTKRSQIYPLTISDMYRLTSGNISIPVVVP